jgi:ABC-type spermidine/putrescine transport system permease subunit I
MSKNHLMEGKVCAFGALCSTLKLSVFVSVFACQAGYPFAHRRAVARATFVELLCGYLISPES